MTAPMTTFRERIEALAWQTDAVGCLVNRDDLKALLADPGATARLVASDEAVEMVAREAWEQRQFLHHEASGEQPIPWEGAYETERETERKIARRVLSAIQAAAMEGV